MLNQYIETCERTAVVASLGALRNHGIHPRCSSILASATVVALEMTKLIAPLIASRTFLFGQAEVKTHHLRIRA
jgi:hypothetical protein